MLIVGTFDKYFFNWLFLEYSHSVDSTLINFIDHLITYKYEHDHSIHRMSYAFYKIIADDIIYALDIGDIQRYWNEIAGLQKH